MMPMERLFRRAPVLALLAFCMITVFGCGERPLPIFTHFGLGEGPGSAGAHIVAEGDTLWTISERYRLPLQDLAVYNNLSPPFKLAYGQRVWLPPPRQYTVQAGDTVYTVARLFNVSASELVRMNRLEAPYRITVGQALRLPIDERKQAVHANSGQPAAVQKDIIGGSFSAPAPADITASPLPPQNIAGDEAPTPAGSSLVHDPVQVGALNRSPSVPSPKPEKPSAGTQKAAASAGAKGPLTGSIPPRAGEKFMRPVSGKVISGYGAKPGGLHNDGINIAAPRGAPVMAAENGVVAYAGNALKGSGNLVLIRHEDRWMTAYAHMDSLKVARGDVIRRGQVIGAVGSTGSVDTPQLHFEIRRGAEALNPAVFMEK